MHSQNRMNEIRWHCFTNIFFRLKAMYLRAHGIMMFFTLFTRLFTRSSISTDCSIYLQHCLNVIKNEQTTDKKNTLHFRFSLNKYSFNNRLALSLIVSRAHSSSCNSHSFCVISISSLSLSR